MSARGHACSALEIMDQRFASADLWAITTYFNPVGYERRRQNYDIFRKKLNLPLVTVELAFSRDPFVLEDGDAEILLQVRGGDVLWQKERLLNLALEVLPPACRTIAWIDCDVILERPDWGESTSAALEEFALIQPFSEFVEVDPSSLAEIPCSSQRRIESLGQRLAIGADPAELALLDGMPSERGMAGGSVWAMRRDVLEQHGFYDACVLGSGDRAIVYAAVAHFDGAITPIQMNRAFSQHYLAWAEPFCESVGGRVGYVDGRLLHLHHGHLAQRRYLDRHRGFAAFDFDPTVDLAFDGEGCWRWNTNKTAMHRYVADYFRSRSEDGD